MLGWISDTIILFLASLVRVYFNVQSSFSFIENFLYFLLNCSPRSRFGFTMVNYIYMISQHLFFWVWLQTAVSFSDVPNSICSVLPTFNFIINRFSVKNLDTFWEYLFKINFIDYTSLAETSITVSPANWIMSQYLSMSDNSLKYIRKSGSENWTLWDATIN